MTKTLKPIWRKLLISSCFVLTFMAVNSSHPRGVSAVLSQSEGQCTDIVASTTRIFDNTTEPQNAVDGDIETEWNAGDVGPQWIELDLQKRVNITRIRLLVEQSPDGDTHHQILARAHEQSEQFRLLDELKGSTVSGEFIEVVPNGSEAARNQWNDVQFIRILTLKSPSWIAWREIEIFGC